jgi:hypothetical protein
MRPDLIAKPFVVVAVLLLVLLATWLDRKFGTRLLARAWLILVVAIVILIAVIAVILLTH